MITTYSDEQSQPGPSNMLNILGILGHIGKYPFNQDISDAFAKAQSQVVATDV